MHATVERHSRDAALQRVVIDLQVLLC